MIEVVLCCPKDTGVVIWKDASFGDELIERGYGLSANGYYVYNEDTHLGRL